ncbi:hypothetical protein DXG01_012583, partial [Tephrocybe rancida]
MDRHPNMPAPRKKQPVVESEDETLGGFLVPDSDDDEVVKVKRFTKSSPAKKKAAVKAKPVSKTPKNVELLELTSSDEEQLVMLEPDDSMYRSPGKSRALGVPAGLNTRAKASAKRRMEPDSPNGDLSPLQEVKPARKKTRAVRPATPVEESGSEAGSDSDDLPASSKAFASKGKVVAPTTPKS